MYYVSFDGLSYSLLAGLSILFMIGANPTLDLPTRHKKS